MRCNARGSTRVGDAIRRQAGGYLFVWYVGLAHLQVCHQSTCSSMVSAHGLCIKHAQL